MELAHVLEISKVAVNDRLSELQAYHLLALAMKEQGGAAIIAPDDVILTKDVLRNHLNSDSAAVERACGRARLGEQQITKKVAATIGRVIGLWRDHHYEAALIEAQKLEKEHPENGDVQCLLGCALIKPGVVRWADADKAFGRAYKANSSRPELLESWIAVKRHLRDWRGLMDITTGKTSARGGLDRAMRANVQARYELIKAASGRGDPGRAAELAKEGMELLARKVSRVSGSHGETEEMMATGHDFAKWHVDGHVRLDRRPNDRFKVFDAVSVCQGLGFANDELLLLARQSLVQWWTAVEAREFIDEQARDILRKRLARLEAIERDAALGGATALEAKLRETRLDLAHRGAKVSSV